ncbi:hypothetical protein LW316_09265 [Clostridioides difficile]|nr:hypothetical protein [Clostridioides difficile]
MININTNKLEKLKQKNDLSKLKVSQTVQDEDIMTSLLANTEIYEMILSLTPTNGESINNMPKTYVAGIGGNSMIEVYVALILKGKKRIEDVPVIIREQVKIRCDELEIPLK